MARCMNMILNDGVVNETRVLDSDVLAEAATPVNAYVYNPAQEYTIKPRYSCIQNLQDVWWKFLRSIHE